MTLNPTHAAPVGPSPLADWDPSTEVLAPDPCEQAAARARDPIRTRVTPRICMAPSRRPKLSHLGDSVPGRMTDSPRLKGSKRAGRTSQHPEAYSPHATREAS